MVTVIVLGMHRSATSMTSRALHKSNEVFMGLNLGPSGAFDNPEGHYEHVPIVSLNDQILASAGGNWRNPPSYHDILSQGPKFQSQIKSTLNDLYLIAEEKNIRSCGFKDPRLCLTIELFYPYLQNPQFITCFRSPQDIANSLLKRNGMSIEEGIKLTKEYNSRIFNFLNTYVE